jgi:hypothetical protein
MENKFGILVYDRGELRLSKAFSSMPLDEALFVFSKWEDKHPDNNFSVYAIDIVPIPEEEDHSYSQMTYLFDDQI